MILLCSISNSEFARISVGMVSCILLIVTMAILMMETVAHPYAQFRLIILVLEVLKLLLLSVLTLELSRLLYHRIKKIH